VLLHADAAVLCTDCACTGAFGYEGLAAAAVWKQLDSRIELQSWRTEGLACGGLNSSSTCQHAAVAIAAECQTSGQHGSEPQHLSQSVALQQLMENPEVAMLAVHLVSPVLCLPM
jgi:hypothetical protein